MSGVEPDATTGELQLRRYNNQQKNLRSGFVDIRRCEGVQLQNKHGCLLSPGERDRTEEQSLFYTEKKRSSHSD